MAASERYPSDARPISTEAPSGWIVFAAMMLLIAGAFDICWGFAAVLNDQVLKVGGGGVIIYDYTFWGWVHILLGAIMLLTCWGLFAKQGWARWTAIVLAAVNTIVQVTVLTTFPLWAIVVIALDIIVIYQLTARWAD